jgi:hypothetical protein
MILTNSIEVRACVMINYASCVLLSLSVGDNTISLCDRVGILFVWIIMILSLILVLIFYNERNEPDIGHLCHVSVSGYVVLNELVEYLFEQPSVLIKVAAESLDRTGAGVNDVMTRLEDTEIVIEMTGRQRYR